MHRTIIIRREYLRKYPLLQPLEDQDLYLEDCFTNYGYRLHPQVSLLNVVKAEWLLLNCLLYRYARYEKRHKNIAAHCSPAFRVEEGDHVTVGQCRPLSKTVRFNVLRVLPRTGKAVKKFSKF